MIRQAISCDICETEMQHPNHWFVSYDQGPELRVSGWNARIRLRTGAKHLCGQTCLHKLVDEFMARTQKLRGSASTEKTASENRITRAKLTRTEVSLTATKVNFVPAGAVIGAGLEEAESSARLIPRSDGVFPHASVQELPISDEASHVAEMPAAPTRTLRAEAWKREREREQRAAAERPALSHRRSIA